MENWKSGIIKIDKRLIERIPLIGIWFWKRRVKVELDKLYKEDQKSIRVWTTREQAMKFITKNIEPILKDEKELKK